MTETIDDPMTNSFEHASGEEWLLPGAVRDRQTITAQWDPTEQQLIDGVEVRQVANVPKQNGYLTEMYRADWKIGPAVAQVFQVVLVPGGISAWHAHESTFDRLFVATGVVRIVLYDARSGSPTQGVINDFRFGGVRPALVLVPPRVWHGVMNIGGAPAVLMNMPDRAYHYEDPDHWRVPADSPEIPFRF
jgi:dTDP-4-dehydrorhamnose 3,5-epimerase